MNPSLPTNNECPSASDLELFVRGTIDEGSIDVIASHIETCENCAKLAQEIDSQLSAFPLFQASGQQEHSPTPADSPVSTERVPSNAINQIGGYLLLECLGEGGMGQVFKARHLHLDRYVAIKVLTSRYAANLDFRGRFLRELRITGQMTHRNIVFAHDAGEDREISYLVMEYLDGLDVAALLKLQGPLSVPQSCEIARQAADALTYLYDHQFVHRDVKPSNLFLTKTGDVKLLDFGLAFPYDSCRTSDHLTTTVWVMGSAAYISPEQATNARNTDIRSDIYSLGCTLFHLLAGEPPFGKTTSTSPIAIIASHLNDTPNFDRLQIPDELCELIGRMLEKNPDDRPQNPALVSEQLRRFTEDAPDSLSPLIAMCDRRTTPNSDRPPWIELQESSASENGLASEEIPPKSSPWLIRPWIFYSAIAVFTIAVWLLLVFSEDFLRGRRIRRLEPELISVDIKMPQSPDGHIIIDEETFPLNELKYTGSVYQIPIQRGAHTMSIQLPGFEEWHATDYRGSKELYLMSDGNDRLEPLFVPKVAPAESPASVPWTALSDGQGKVADVSFGSFGGIAPSHAEFGPTGDTLIFAVPRFAQQLTGEYASELIEYDLRTGRKRPLSTELGRPLSRHGLELLDMVLMRKGRRLFLSAQGNHPRFVDLEAEHVTILDKAREANVAARPIITADEEWAFLSNSGLEKIHLPSQSVAEYVPGVYHSLSLSADERRLAGIKGGNVSFLDTGNLEQVATLELDTVPSQIAFSPVSPTELLVGDGEGRLRLRNLQSNSWEKFFSGHDSEIVEIAFANDGQRFISISSQQILHVWDINHVRPIATYELHVLEPVPNVPPTLVSRLRKCDSWKISVSPDDRFFLISSCGEESICQVYALPTTPALSQSETEQECQVEGKVVFAKISPRDEFLIIATDSHSVPLVVWDIHQKKRTHSLEAQKPFLGMSLSGFGHQILLQDESHIWVYPFPPVAEKSWSPIFGKEFPYQPGSPKGILSPDGMTVFAATYRTVSAWSVESGRPIAESDMPTDSISISHTSTGLRMEYLQPNHARVHRLSSPTLSQPEVSKPQENQVLHLVDFPPRDEPPDEDDILDRSPSGLIVRIKDFDDQKRSTLVSIEFDSTNDLR